MPFELIILQLYPEEMNIYGDNGNLLTLKRRMEWRDITCNVRSYHSGEDFEKLKPDIILCGGGQDSNQLKITDDWLRLGPKLAEWIEKGVPTLMVCGSYQLLGKSYETSEGKIIEGAGILDFRTVASKERLIGNVVIESPEFGQLVGYENHSGRTFLSKDLQSIGKVVKGGGNNGRDGQEGLRYKNLVATYLHGPILTKNPRLADFLIAQALKNQGFDEVLAELNDSLERASAEQSASRPR